MVLSAAAASDLTLPADFWVWGAFTLLLACSIGFAAGIAYAKVALKWRTSRASRQFSRLFAIVLEQLETAHEVCSMLEKFPGLLLTGEELERLQQRQSKLIESLAHVAESHHAAGARFVEHKPAPPVELKLEWQRQPEDNSGVPDRSALDANLAMLLEAGAAGGLDSGLLLVKVDRLDQLKSRHGAAGVDAVLRRFAGVVCLGMRDVDVVCRHGSDTFAVLFPGVTCAAGVKLAEGIRRRVQNHRFRISDTAPEILVTASFGYAACQPHDAAPIALDRAGTALANSERRGRNQLHVHDGSRATQYLAAS